MASANADSVVVEHRVGVEPSQVEIMSVVGTYHKLGYGDLMCYQTGCEGAVMFIWDSYECATGDSCEALGDDLGEYLSEKN
jgi:hypothetical protein